MEHEPPDTDQQPLMQPPDPADLVRQYYNEIIAGKASLLNAESVFTQEQNVGLAQRTQILNSIDQIHKPIQKFAKLLEPPASPPSALNSQRHHLLMQFHKAEKLISQDLIPHIAVPIGWPSAAQIEVRRRKVLSDLKLLMESFDYLENLLKPLLDQSVSMVYRGALDDINSYTPSTNIHEKLAETQAVSSDNPIHIPDAEHQLPREATTLENIQEKALLIDQAPLSPPVQSFIVEIPGNLPPQLPQQPPLYAKIDHAKLREAISSTFNSEELEILCHNLNVKYDILKGDSLENKIIRLIEYFDHRGMYEVLIIEVLRMRPNIKERLSGDVVS